MWLYLLCPLPILFAVISFIFNIKGGNKEKVNNTNIYYYPPEGLNSTEVAFIQKGYADDIEIMSFLIYLANKGYIRIEKKIKDSMFSSSKDYKIVKLKEYDGNNSNEKLFLTRLFYSFDAKVAETEEYKKSNKNSFEEGIFNKNLKEVTHEDLYDVFYYTLSDIAKNLNSKEKYYALFDKKSDKNHNRTAIMLVISIFLTLFIPTYYFYGLLWESIATPFLLALWFFLFAFPIILTKNKLIKILSLVIATVATSVFWINILNFNKVINNGFMIVWFFISILCILIIRYSLTCFEKRTPYGLEMFEKTSGFKKFIETAKEDKIKEIISNNPNYFYEVLPYAYALEVENKWIAKFKNIYLQQPSWYLGYDEFNVKSFCSFIKSVMKDCSDYDSSDVSSVV